MLTLKQIEELRQFDTPTVSNAIEKYKIRPRNEGFMGPEIKSILPIDKPVVGYACTAKVSANKPATEEQKLLVYEYYKKLQASPKPTITVIEDIDVYPVGSFWGDVNVSQHKALGCSGVITNGGVRDIDEVAKMDFLYFASTILVSHAYVHLEDYDCPVKVGGLIVRPGDLLHADKHGVCLIPKEIAAELTEACREVQCAEEPVVKGCFQHFKNGDVKIDDLKLWREEMERRRNS